MPRREWACWVVRTVFPSVLGSEVGQALGGSRKGVPGSPAELPSEPEIWQPQGPGNNFAKTAGPGGGFF